MPSAETTSCVDCCETEAALAAGADPAQIAGIGCLRALQRMGEEIADDQLPRFAELEARMERDFALITPATPAEAQDAAHG